MPIASARRVEEYDGSVKLSSNCFSILRRSMSCLMARPAPCPSLSATQSPSILTMVSDIVEIVLGIAPPSDTTMSRMLAAAAKSRLLPTIGWSSMADEAGCNERNRVFGMRSAK